LASHSTSLTLTHSIYLSCPFSISIYLTFSHTWRQFHQHFTHKFFVRTYVLAASTMTFVRKKCAFYVDEIDTCSILLTFFLTITHTHSLHFTFTLFLLLSLAQTHTLSLSLSFSPSHTISLYNTHTLSQYVFLSLGVEIAVISSHYFLGMR
jgi:hypothetical protein